MFVTGKPFLPDETKHYSLLHLILSYERENEDEQEVMLSCSFRCDQICINHLYDYGHTLLHSLSLT
jgi:hypothetical protein